MLHRSDLSSRPGRRRAESIRSGRLGMTRIVNGCQRDQGINTPLPSSGKDINPIETLRTIHQCQELVDNPISNSGTVMSTFFFKKIQFRIGDRRQDERSSHRLGAIESNSSKNSTHGLAALALSKSSLTDFSLAPIYLFNSSGPLMLIKFKPHSFTAVEASSVFPQPGYP